jgi:murein DD-endopeptidase MepM/ murein hydrolase activator NlpD
MRKTGGKRKQVGYHILLIPDDDRPPFSLHLGPQRIRLLKIVGAILCAHVLLGAALYVVAGHQWRQNSRLRQENEALRGEVKRIEKVAAEFERLEEAHRKIRALLGLEREGGQLPQVGMGARTGEGIPPLSFLDNPGSSAATAIVGPATLSLLTERSSEAQFLAASLPTQLPVEGILTADFDPVGQGHFGIDIAARRGSVVRAAGAGLVVFAGWTPELGNLLIIYHGRGLFSYYGHNGRLLKSARSWVRKGEPIALVGSSGESSGPHLHFEIWLDGKPCDPKSYLMAFARPSEGGQAESR